MRGLDHPVLSSGLHRLVAQGSLLRSLGSRRRRCVTEIDPRHGPIWRYSVTLTDLGHACLDRSASIVHSAGAGERCRRPFSEPGKLIMTASGVMDSRLGASTTESARAPGDRDGMGRPSGRAGRFCQLRRQLLLGAAEQIRCRVDRGDANLLR